MQNNASFWNDQAKLGLHGRLRLIVGLVLVALVSVATYLSSTAQQDSPTAPLPAEEPAAPPPQAEAQSCDSFGPAPHPELSPQLLSAVRSRNVRLVRELLSKGADVNARDKHCETALMLAVESPSTALSQALIAAGADVNARDVVGWTALHSAVDAGNASQVRLLLSKQADIEAADENGWTPLIAAVLAGSVDSVEALLSAGANINTQDRGGITPLMYAAAEGQVAVLRLLLDPLGKQTAANDAALNQASMLLEVTDRDGWTAEIRIPLSQLRFVHQDSATWGINVERFIRRNNESAWLEMVPKGKGGVNY